MDTMFEDGLCRFGHYYDDNLEILKLEILRRDYITLYRTSQEDGNKELALLSLASLPDLAGSSSLDNEFMVCHPPMIGYFLDIDKNPETEVVSIKKGALALADESGIFMSEEDIDNKY